MLDLPDMEAVRAALKRPLDPELKTLLSDLLADTLHRGLENLTHVLVLEADDTERDVVEAVGFSPLVSRLDDQPDWDWLDRDGGWWRALYCVGDSGFAFVLLIEDADRSPFARLCRGRGGNLES